MHHIYLQRCIELALRAHKHTKSNPMVGALLVYNNQIIGEGYHETYGKSHAEVNAIKSVKKENEGYIENSTMYVTLEPCNNHGKTPPCCNLILDRKIKNLIVGTLDPNPLMNGKSISLLKENGVNVEVIDINNLCKGLISKFEVNLDKQCYVILKFAKSYDNFIGHKNMQIPISGPVSKYYTHKLRTQVDGILIGSNTAIIDNPQLNARYFTGENPTRIILDKDLRVPLSNHIFLDGQKTIIINQKIDKTEGVVQYIKHNEDNLSKLPYLLYELGIYSVLVEGGGRILEYFVQNNLWHEARIITNKQRLLSKYNESELVQAPNIKGRLVEKIKFDDLDKMAIIKR